jgi:hypothetical protein
MIRKLFKTPRSLEFVGARLQGVPTISVVKIVFVYLTPRFRVIKSSNEGVMNDEL